GSTTGTRRILPWRSTISTWRSTSLTRAKQTEPNSAASSSWDAPCCRLSPNCATKSAQGRLVHAGRESSRQASSLVFIFDFGKSGGNRVETLPRMTSSSVSRRLVRTTLHGRGASPTDGCLVGGRPLPADLFCRALLQIGEGVAETLQADRDADAGF